MSLSVVGAALVVVAAGVLLWTWRMVKWVWIKPKMLESCLRRQGIAGTPYIPLIGDTKRNVDMVMEARSKPINLTDDITPRLLPLALKMLKSHGKTFFLWSGPIPTIVITDTQQIKEIFNKVYDYEKPTTFPLLRLLAGGLVGDNGDKWARHRRIINPAFHLNKIKNMVPAFYNCCSEVVSQWEDLFTDKESPLEVDIWPWLVNLTSDVISQTAFGSSYKEGQRIFQLQGELAELVSQAFKTYSYIPGFSFYPTKSNRRMKAIDREIHVILRGIVSKREKAREAGEPGNDDLLGILLESNSEESQGHGMSVEELMTECKLFYFAGQETTAVLLVWTMILLSHHQDWQARAREEVRQILGENNKPDMKSLNNLKVMTMIFNEVLRLYPPAAMLIRDVNKEMKLGELTIPVGVQIYLPTLLVQRDTELWGDDAADFNPDRFRDGLSKATKNQVSFFPFGWGPRICIGQNFSLFEAKMAMALILQRFSFELSPSYVHAPQFVMTTRPQFGAHLILHKL